MHMTPNLEYEGILFPFHTQFMWLTPGQYYQTTIYLSARNNLDAPTQVKHFLLLLVALFFTLLEGQLPSSQINHTHIEVFFLLLINAWP